MFRLSNIIGGGALVGAFLLKERQIMKTIPLIIGAVMSIVLAGCVSTKPVAVAPVGPNPSSQANP